MLGREPCFNLCFDFYNRIFYISVRFSYMKYFGAIFAPFLTPFGESEIVGSEFELWGTVGKDGQVFILGTDNLGRDMLTRLLYGARNTIGIAFVTDWKSFEPIFWLI